MTTPIFILSLPRSGSTLLQRLIATHPAVATTSETWLLLPIFLGYREGHVFASWRQRYLAAAFEDFISELPDGQDRFREAVRRFSGTLFEAACAPGQTHFLDKTPRYHLIAEELIETFPDARFVLLWRNPLAVAASCVTTWARGRFYPDFYRIDLRNGIENLLDVRQRFGDRLLVLNYEDLVTDPNAVLQNVFAHCGLPPIDDAAGRLADVMLRGRMGDHTGEASSDVSTASRDAWPSDFATLPRRAWARRYLQWIGDDRLAAMRYDPKELRQRLDGQPLGWKTALSDAFWLIAGGVAARLQWLQFRRRRTLVSQGIAPDVPYE